MEKIEIISDSDDETSLDNIVTKQEIKKDKGKVKKGKETVKECYNIDPSIVEIGVDEAGRGPLFGRVYTAAVVLPKGNGNGNGKDGENQLFNHSLMKDSKRFHSKTKIQSAAEYIKANAIAWSVTYSDEKLIDEINILQATQQSMHNSIRGVINTLSSKPENISEDKIILLIDGNYFNPIMVNNKPLDYITIEGGDNKYSCIAAASILAKVERDKYIYDLCQEHPELIVKYALDSNKGYGAKKHIEGIKQFGITKWHRKSFRPCK